MDQCLACADPAHRNALLNFDEGLLTGNAPQLVCQYGCRYRILEHGVIDASQDAEVHVYDNPEVFDSKADKIITVGEDNPIRLLYLEEIRLRSAKAMVIDAGCGTGKESKVAGLALREGGHLVCIDISRHMAIATAEMLDRYVPWIRRKVICADAAAIPMCSGVADIWVGKQLLNRAANPENLLQEAMRVLRPGGKLLLQVPSTRHYSNMLIPRLDCQVPLAPPCDDLAHPEGRGYTIARLLATTGAVGFVKAQVKAHKFWHVASTLGDALKFLYAKGYGKLDVPIQLWRVIDLPMGIFFPGEYLAMKAVKL